MGILRFSSRMSRLAGCFAVFTLGVCSATSSLARPGNPERFPVGARAVGRGGAGAALEPSPWFNPAGAGRADRSSISASVSAYGLSLERIDAAVELGDIRGTIESSAFDIFPASLSYVRPLEPWGGRTHGFGLSVMVPDWESFDGNFDLPAQAEQFVIRGRRFAETQTIWAVPGYGLCTSPTFSIGIGLPVSVHMERDTTILTVQVGSGIAQTDSAVSQYSDLLTVAGAVSLGAQMKIAPNLWLSLTARSPTVSAYDTGSIIVTEARVSAGAPEDSAIDRVEVSDATVQYRQPWRFEFGLGYEDPKKLVIAADVRVMLDQGRYLARGGPNGELSLAPLDVNGDPIDDPLRVIDVGYEIENKLTMNGRLGAELYPQEDLAIQLGMYTDLTSTTERSIAVNGVDDRVSRIGATFG